MNTQDDNACPYCNNDAAINCGNCNNKDKHECLHCDTTLHVYKQEYSWHVCHRLKDKAKGKVDYDTTLIVYFLPAIGSVIVSPGFDLPGIINDITHCPFFFLI